MKTYLLALSLLIGGNVFSQDTIFSHRNVLVPGVYEQFWKTATQRGVVRSVTIDGVEFKKFDTAQDASNVILRDLLYADENRTYDTVKAVFLLEKGIPYTLYYYGVKISGLPSFINGWIVRKEETVYGSIGLASTVSHVMVETDIYLSEDKKITISPYLIWQHKTKNW